MACLDVCSHLEGAGGVEGVDQQPPAPGVRGQSAHRAALMTVNLRRHNIMLHYCSNQIEVLFYFVLSLLGPCFVLESSK